MSQFSTKRPASVPTMTEKAAITPFYFENQPVRGVLVRPGALVAALLDKHQNPPAVDKVSAEAMALTAGLAAMLKFEGSFSLQIKGNGPLSLLFTDCTNQGALRFYARFDEEAAAKGLLNEACSTGQCLGKGFLALTVEQGENTDNYQGIVGFEEEDLATAACRYFNESEQLATFVQLFTGRDSENKWQSAALILQKIAEERRDEQSEENQEAFETVTSLAKTLSAREVLDQKLSSPESLARLFAVDFGNEISLREARELSFGCRCTEKKLAGILSGFNAEELEEMAEEGLVTITCEFCKCDFKFSQDILQKHKNPYPSEEE